MYRNSVKKMYALYVYGGNICAARKFCAVSVTKFAQFLRCFVLFCFFFCAVFASSLIFLRDFRVIFFFFAGWVGLAECWPAGGVDVPSQTCKKS